MSFYRGNRKSDRKNIEISVNYLTQEGKGLPEVSCMIPSCNILGINVNELLSGEKLTEENYQRKAEENMLNLIREKNESKKKLFFQQW